MHAGHHYSFREVIVWTRRDSYWLLAIATLPTVLFVLLDWRWLAVPWVPIALLGTAVAFIVGFKNNATYARAWEARQIYGSIVNTSRSFGAFVRAWIRPGPALDAPAAAAARARLVHRHIAWLTALRYQLRQPRPWESMAQPHNVEYRDKWFSVAEHKGDLDAQLAPLLAEDDRAALAGKTNRAVHLLAMQARDLAALHAQGALEHNHHLALARLVADLYDHEGRAERIKNFPYPRQFATINLFLMRIFVIVMPFGLLAEFDKLGPGRVWLTIPAAFLVGWVFNAMERVGESTESPFEGSANDIPITTMSRAIEIDLRELLGEASIPPPIAATHDIQL